MSCERCGSPSQGRLCADCEQIDHLERDYEHMMNDGGTVTAQEPAEPARRQLEYIPLSELSRHEDARDIRGETVEEIQERIDADEYNPAKPLRVFETPEGYVVADGNHRLEALRKLDYSGSVPCVVEPVTDPEYAEIVEVAAKSNRDEDTFAEDDLFDHLDRIERLSDEHTQAEIAETLGDGWSLSKVKNHSQLTTKIVTPVLEIAREHQDGRVTSEVTSVTFSEYWFRTSGLYDLNRDGVDEYATPADEKPKHAQMRVMEWFIHDQNGDATKNAVQAKVDEVAEVCDQLDRLAEELNPGVDNETRAEIREEIVAGGYTDDTLASAIENANQGAKNRAEYGTDALAGLETVEPDTIDCVVTDPPYGADFESVRPTENPDFEDGADATFDLLDDVFAELERVCKANAHLYVFFSMEHYERVVGLADQYFEVNATPLIWVKNNHAPNAPGNGGFEKNYAQRYEPVLHCRMPNGDRRKLNGGVSPNTLNYQKPGPDTRRHDTQKPDGLLRELIQNSTGKRETVCDPFAGSGSTLLAADALDRHYVGFEIDDEYASGFRRELRKNGGGL